MVPEIEPRAQHSLFSLSNEKYSLSVVILSKRVYIVLSMDLASILVRKMRDSRIYS